MKIMLKSFWETKDIGKVQKYKQHLENIGWMDNIMEGGMVSPDSSTIFIYSRAPYIGQLMPFMPTYVNYYNNIVNEMILYDKFIKI